MWLQNGTQIIKTPRSLTVGDITYPSAVFRDADLLATLGITPYREVKVNQRYYWQGELTIADGVGTYAEIDRDVDQLKEGMVSTVKGQVGSKLKATDWQVIREMDGGTAMAQDLKDYRTAIRAEGNAKETEILALATLADVIAYENKPYTSVTKVKHTSEEGVETYGPETEESDVELNMTMHFEATDPTEEVDPSFVSLTAK